MLGIARRVPEWSPSKVEWESADVARSSLVPLLEGADAVIHLAWLIQPSRDQEETRAVNVEGSRRVFKAAAVAKVPRLVYASSVGAYSPGPKHATSTSRTPREGSRSSFYSRHKAEVESVLDEFEADHANVSVARLRPGLIFKGDAASGIRRLFAGPFPPTPAAAPLPDSVRARHRGTALPGCPLRRRRGGVSARGKERRAVPSTSPPSRCSILPSWRRLLGAGPSVPPGPLRAATGPAGRPASSPRPPGGSTWRWRAPDGHDPGSVGLGWAPSRTQVRRCSSSSMACAAARGSRPRRWRRAETAPCAWASSPQGSARGPSAARGNRPGPDRARRARARRTRGAPAGRGRPSRSDPGPGATRWDPRAGGRRRLRS